jgi:hypothetical protein
LRSIDTGCVQAANGFFEQHSLKMRYWAVGRRLRLGYGTYCPRPAAWPAARVVFFSLFGATQPASSMRVWHAEGHQCTSGLTAVTPAAHRRMA